MILQKPLQVKIEPRFPKFLGVSVTVGWNDREISNETWPLERFLKMAMKLPQEFWVGGCKVKLSQVDRVLVEDQMQLVADQMGYGEILSDV